MARLLLDELHVNRIEIASARVSEGEFESVRRIAQWAAARGYLDRVEVLGFVDNGVSLKWIADAGCRVVNLLAKGSRRHCELQLRKTPQQHFADIKTAIAQATEMGIAVNIYLEDWSNGMRFSPDYVYEMVDTLKREPIRRFMIPDTLGVLNPDDCYAFCRDMVERYPELHFDFHAHNDYDLAVANVAAAVKAGVQGIHTTVNGLGERAGNAPLSSVIAVLNDHLKVRNTIVEKSINHVSRIVETYTGIHIPANEPVALGKMSGKANIKKNLDTLGIDLDEEAMRKVTERIIELGDKKQAVTSEDLPYIIADILKQDVYDVKVHILNYNLSLSYGLRPVATVKIRINDRDYEETSSGDGQYDAFMRAIRKIYKEQLKRDFPMLVNYSVSIPPGGRTDAFVQTYITWEYRGETFKTRGLDADQTEAAIKATLKMLNKVENILNQQSSGEN